MKNLFILLVLTLVACQQKKPTPVDQKEVISPEKLITCDGVGEIKMNLSYSGLEKLVGAQSISEHDNTVYGKFFTIWEGEERQLNIYWNEQNAPYKTIKYIEVNAGPYYLTPDSLQVGLSMRDMVRLNGNLPLTFNNFSAERDNGLITSFNGGDIAKINPCISGTLEIIAERNVHVADRRKFNAKDTVESFDQLLERMDVALQSIRVYPENK